MAVEHEQKPYSVGANFVHAEVRHVCHRNGVLTRRLQIDHIYADPITRNHFAPRQRFDRMAVNFSPLDDERIRIINMGDEHIGS